MITGLMNTYTWKMGAKAGQGVMSTGLAMAKLATKLGHHIFAYAEYPSLVQGGHNTYEILIAADSQPGATLQPVDCLVCMDAETYELHKNRLHSESLVIFDPTTVKVEVTTGRVVHIPVSTILNKHKAFKLMTNMVLLSASVAAMGGEFELVQTVIEAQFGKKGGEKVALNQAVAADGFTHVLEQYSDFIKPILKPVPDSEPQLVMTGNEAFSLGAVAADCKFYAAYPMTPTSAVLTILAEWQQEAGMVVRHAEDEIGVVSEALGASFMGVRSAVGTSGGGFALMTESLSYAGVAEIPLVVFLGMRPGPATGMPTWTDQGDLLFAVHAGHGEFPKIVLAPGSLPELLQQTMKASNLAELYQLPVIVLSDKYLCESAASVAESVVTELSISPLGTSSSISASNNSTEQDKPYLRYESTESGISPRMIPGTPGHFYQANSYEHAADSHTSEEAADRIEQVNKRARKLDTYLSTDWQLPTIYGDIASADLVIVSWGSVQGPVEMARTMLHEKTSAQTAHIHFTHLFPLDQAQLKELFSFSQQTLLVENNSRAQFGQLLREQTGIDLTQNTLLKYDGRPISPEEIVVHVRKQLELT